MPSAYLDTSRGVTYPPICPHCGERADATYPLVARSFVDILFDYVPPLFAPVPVCRAAARRRKRRGALSLTAGLTFLVVGVFIALEIGMSGYVTSGIALTAAAGLVGIAFRTGWEDRLLDWTTLGVSAWRVRSFERLVRFNFRSDQYFSHWAASNPEASIAGPVVRRVSVSSATPRVENPLARTRLAPAVVLAVAAGILVLHHWYARGGHASFVAVVMFVSGAGALALGGVVYPPVFWSLSDYGRHLPRPTKVIGATLALAGIVAGFLLAISYRR